MHVIENGVPMILFIYKLGDIPPFWKYMYSGPDIRKGYVVCIHNFWGNILYHIGVFLANY